MGLFNATATYGHGFKLTTNPDEYIAKIYTGGFAGQGTATKRLVKEMEPFMLEKGYSKYDISSVRFNLFPSFYKFIIRFEK